MIGAAALGSERGNETVRLVYPQWQGGDIARWLPEIPDAAEAARGYLLGAQVLDFVVPPGEQRTLVVPVATERRERRVTEGVLDLDEIEEQTGAALRLLEEANPRRVVTVGGECSVSVVPFTFLASRYEGDVAMVWIDAHPDITLPGDVYAGYHAMAAAACLGLGHERIIRQLPGRIERENVLFVGLRDWEREEIRERQKALGLKHLSPEDVRSRPEALREWLRGCNATKVVVHLDLDVLDPEEIIAAVGVSPDGMRMGEVVEAIRAVAEEKELVGLTVAEYMPRTLIRIRDMLTQIPLIGSQQKVRHDDEL